MARYGNDIETGTSEGTLDGNGSFSNKSIRRAFIQKVYGILSLQLALTAAVSAYFLGNSDANGWILRNTWIHWVALIIFTCTYLPLICCPSVGRSVPLNYLLLLIMTLAMSITVALFCVVYRLEAVAIASGITMIVVIMVSLFSCHTSFDFTKCIWIMAMVMLAFIISGFVLIILKLCGINVKFINMIYAAFGAAIYTVYLAIDTQMIIGGKRYEIGPEDYVYATIALYIDIVQIFLYILQIVGNSRD